MSITKPTARTLISNDLKEAERALDEALLRQAELFATMITVRRETDSAPATGHEALLRLVKSQQTTLAAGGELARVHGSMLKIQRDVLGYEQCPKGQPMAEKSLESLESIAA